MPFDSIDFKDDVNVDITSKEGRLTHLIQVMQAVPPYHLSLLLWNCGSIACVAGWASRDLAFQSQGFFSNHQYGDVNYINVDEQIFLKGLEAARHFFKLTQDQAKFLFLSTSYDNAVVTSDMVIQHIETILAVG